MKPGPYGYIHNADGKWIWAMVRVHHNRGLVARFFSYEGVELSSLEVPVAQACSYGRFYRAVPELVRHAPPQKLGKQLAAYHASRSAGKRRPYRTRSLTIVGARRTI